MGRLFWKIFALLLLVGTLVFSGGFYLFTQVQEHGVGERLANRIMHQLAAEVVAAYESGGKEGFHRWLSQHRHSGRRGRVTLETPDGTQLPRPLRPRLNSQLTGSSIFYHPANNPIGPFFVNMVSRQGEQSGETYRVIAIYQSPTEFIGARTPLLLLPLLTLMAASALLAWLITRPLSQLKSATRRFAHGELKARTPLTVHTRKDVIGDLAREHDQMADRISGLLEAQRQLVRDVSHELRSPLARMAVAATLAESAEGSDREAAASRIHDEIQRMDNLIEDLLTLSRIQSGVVEWEFSDCELHELTKEVAADAAFEFGGDQINIGPADPVTIRADCRRLRQALENIVRNALRFATSSKGVQITLEAHASDVTLTIADDGPGIDPQHLARIFEPFFRSDTARQPHGGHGVGLAIAQAMIVGHHGSIRAYNRDTGGLAVVVQLPRNPEA